MYLLFKAYGDKVINSNVFGKKKISNILDKRISVRKEKYWYSVQSKSTNYLDIKSRLFLNKLSIHYKRALPSTQFFYYNKQKKLSIKGYSLTHSSPFCSFQKNRSNKLL